MNLSVILTDCHRRSSLGSYYFSTHSYHDDYIYDTTQPGRPVGVRISRVNRHTTHSAQNKLVPG